MSDTAVMALVAMVGTGIGLIVQMLGRRDQLKYDIKLALVEASQKECMADGVLKDARIASLESEVVKLRAVDVSDKAELNAKIKTIKGQDDTGTYVPFDPDDPAIHDSPPGSQRP